MPQQVVVPFAVRVEELVALGRLPHEDLDARGPHRPTGPPSPPRSSGSGSGTCSAGMSGSSRSANASSTLVALAVAQTAPVLILDEPTVHLDLRHQVGTMELLVDLNERDGTTVVAVLHDLGLAATFFSRLVLLDGGRVVADGPPAEVLSDERIREVFGVDPSMVRLPAAACVIDPVRLRAALARRRRSGRPARRCLARSRSSERPSRAHPGPGHGSPARGTGGRVRLVGALIGAARCSMPCCLAVGDLVPTVAAILAMAMLAVLSGGLHLDGLADTFDALVAAGPDAAERARKDPAVGAAGATTLILRPRDRCRRACRPCSRRGDDRGGGVACVVAGAAVAG